jgi:hypothetical protein
LQQRLRVHQLPPAPAYKWHRLVSAQWTARSKSEEDHSQQVWGHARA